MNKEVLLPIILHSIRIQNKHNKPILALAIATLVHFIFSPLIHNTQLMAHAEDGYEAIELNLVIKESHIDLEAVIPYSTFVDTVVTNLPENQLIPALLEKNHSYYQQSVTNYFGRVNQFKIDQIQVLPAFRRIRILNSVSDQSGFEQGEPDAESQAEPEATNPLEGARIEITVRYSAKQKFNAISLRWGTYLPIEYSEDSPPGPDAPTSDSISLMISAFSKIKFHRLTVEEPLYQWHHSRVEIIDEDLLSAKPFQTVFWHINVILVVSIMMACISFIFLITRYLRHAKKPVQTQMITGCFMVIGFGGTTAILTSLGILPGYNISVSKPGQPTFSMPEEQEASRIFSRLHANIYRAFDYTNDSQIYDTLAQSCDGPVLALVFNQIYQSLVMAEEGGALAKVEKVVIQQINNLRELPQTESDQLAFQIECQWEVHGVVRHFGHTHSRANEYIARYTLAPRMVSAQTVETKEKTAAWRIIDYEIISEKPIELPSINTAKSKIKIGNKTPQPFDNPY